MSDYFPEDFMNYDELQKRSNVDARWALELVDTIKELRKELAIVNKTIRKIITNDE
jgi:hypothetical protein